MKRAFLFIISLVLSFSFLSVSKAKFVCVAENDNVSLAKNAKSAILMDANSDFVLFEKNSDERLPIASMTKMMSLSIIFDEIEKESINLEDKVTISENAAQTEGSQAFLDANKTYLVKDLLKSIIISSANDSTVALSEAVAGNETEFVRKMNSKAKELNLVNTHFENSTGLSANEHYSSAKDCAIIYKEIMDNPIYLEYSKIWMTDLIHPSGRRTELVNTNRLVKTYPGCDSGKTGYTSLAKYCLTCSARRGETRLVGVVIGEPDSKTRFSEVREMFDYGFANYKSNVVLDKDEFSAEIDIFNGKIDKIYGKIENSYSILTKNGEKLNVKVIIEDNDPRAPIEVGDVIGKVLVVDENGVVIFEDEILANEAVAKMQFFDHFKHILNHW